MQDKPHDPQVQSEQKHTFDQASPMDMAPRHSGDTRTPAVLDRILYRPSSVGGAGAGWKKSAILGSSEFCVVSFKWGRNINLGGTWEDQKAGRR
jgi:hypothetical protein